MSGPSMLEGDAHEPWVSRAGFQCLNSDLNLGPKLGFVLRDAQPERDPPASPPRPTNDETGTPRAPDERKPG